MNLFLNATKISFCKKRTEMHRLQNYKLNTWKKGKLRHTISNSNPPCNLPLKTFTFALQQTSENKISHSHTFFYVYKIMKTVYILAVYFFWKVWVPHQVWDSKFLDKLILLTQIIPRRRKSSWYNLECRFLYFVANLKNEKYDFVHIFYNCKKMIISPKEKLYAKFIIKIFLIRPPFASGSVAGWPTVNFPV